MYPRGTIIPLKDRSQRRAHGTQVAPPPGRQSRRPALTALAAVVALVGAGVLFTLVDARNVRRAQSLSDATRRELYDHGMQELTTICTLPSAAAGPLREHCLEQARFVALLPECRTECRLAVGAVQPHARR
jgi:hypothetical protein